MYSRKLLKMKVGEHCMPIFLESVAIYCDRDQPLYVTWIEDKARVHGRSHSVLYRCWDNT